MIRSRLQLSRASVLLIHNLQTHLRPRNPCAKRDHTDQIHVLVRYRDDQSSVAGFAIRYDFYAISATGLTSATSAAVFFSFPWPTSSFMNGKASTSLML